MLNSSSPASAPADAAPRDEEPGAMRDAARWWEPRRILYNFALAAVFVALTARTWPRLQPELNSSAILPLIVLALLANLCYSGAYVVALAAFSSAEPRHRNRWRWALFSTGTLCAMLFETYWFLDEILPPMR